METDEGLSAPAEVPAGLNLVTLDNQFDGYGEAQIVLLPADVTLEQLEAVVATEVFPYWVYQTVWAGAAVSFAHMQVHAVVNLTPGKWSIVNTDSDVGHAPSELTVTGEAAEPELDAVPSDLEV